MKSIEDFLSELSDLDIKLYTDGQRLRCDAPKGTLTSTLQSQLVERKTEILTFLRRANLDDSGDRAQPLPTIVPNLDERYQPFPLTDVQQAYWVGRNRDFELSNIATHGYMELESANVEVERFENAWHQLIERHETLRMIVHPDGRQQILAQVPAYKIKRLDLRGHTPEHVASQLTQIREQLSHQVLPADQWPLFEIQASLLDQHKVRFHLSFDFLIADSWSFNIILGELVEFIQSPDSVKFPRLDLSFRDYVLAEIALRDSPLYQSSKEYWLNRIPTLPPAPELPLSKNLAAVKQPRFRRRRGTLEPDIWQRLKRRANQSSLTPSGLLLAAFAEVLTLWSKSPRFTLNLTLFNRLPLHPQVNQITGDFTSLTLLAIDHSEQDSFAVRSRRIQKQLWDNVEHRHFSGVQVLRELARIQKNSSGVLMPVVFTSTLINDNFNRDQDRAKHPSISELGDVVYSVSQTPQIYLDHQVYEQAGSLIFSWDAVEELFPAGLLDDMFAAYSRFLERLIDEDELWHTSTRQLLLPVQLEQLAIPNATDTPIPETALLHSLFFEQAQQQPQRIAIATPNRTLTYQEVSDRALTLAHHLRQQGSRPNQLVAIVMEKGWEQVVAALAVLASGAAYVPIDPDLPTERRSHLLEQTDVQWVLTQSHLDSSLDWSKTITRLCVDTSEPASVLSRLDWVQQPDDLAYVIYTSGSTGKPKGVMIDHRGAVNTILDINQRFQVSANDRVLTLSSLSFDLSVYDIFGVLAAGGTIVIPDPSEAKDPAHWVQLMVEQQVTIWNSVPALMQMLVDYSAVHPKMVCKTLRLVLLSGDWIPLSLPDQIKALAETVNVISLGGATEASIWSILYPIEAVDPNWKSVPYGRPMANQHFYVFNEALELLPMWVPGQLYIGGIGLAKGYWRDEEKTSASFIIHPVTDERLYNTGDLGFYLPDGDIAFIGRSDFQVKVQGYRVELGEIEATLKQLAVVKEAVVQAIGEQQHSKRLVAYVVLHPSSAETAETPEALRQRLKETLPEYMVPSNFVFLETLPLTPNGKIDRRALPTPIEQTTSHLQTQKIERKWLTVQITQLVKRELNLETIDPNANLLELGATSIDIVRIANLLEQQFHYRLKIKDLIRFSTIAALVKHYEEHLLQETVYEDIEWLNKGNQNQSLLNFKVLSDLEERQQFKELQLGLRRVESAAPNLQLITPDLNRDLKQKYLKRRSYRKFTKQPISFEQFSQFLSCWQQLWFDGKPKFQYASAGGLYPVQPYLYVKPDRIEGISPGIYYYHPAEHQLLLLSNAEIDRTIHAVSNQLIFDESAFSIFLIGQLAAIAPMYGELSRDFCLIEAGLMSQLLDMSASNHQIGLCHIGVCDFEPVQHLFTLDDSHIYLYCLLGGQINPHEEIELDSVSASNDWEEGAL